MNLSLTKPIVFFDLETTGIDPVNDRIVQIAVIKKLPNGDAIEKEMLINPEIPIPIGATDVHGITDEMVADKPKFRQVAKAIFEFFEDCDIAGYNSNHFDVPFLASSFERCGIVFPSEDSKLIDMLAIERKLNSNTLEEVYKRYTGSILLDAHDALADVRATLTVFEHQIKRLPKSVEEIELLQNDGKKRADIAGRLLYDDDDNLCFAFGKHKGKKVRLNVDYAHWMLGQNFPEQTKVMIRKEIGIAQ